MENSDSPSAVCCKLCGEAFILPEAEADGNLPRVLLCGHIYCTFCLQSIEHDCIIKCPNCEVESTLPEGGVNGLQEDSRIIGLIYTAKMNKMRSLRCDKSKNQKMLKLKLPEDINANIEAMGQPADIEKIETTVDEALARAAENLAQLEHIHETLSAGLAQQVTRERVRLETEIKQVAEKAIHSVQKWKDLQLNQLTKLTLQFSTSKAEVSRVQERLKALEIAIQIAREVRRVPLLEQYCTLDKVLETLEAPVYKQSFDMNCIKVGARISYALQSESSNQSLTLSLKRENSRPKHMSESPSKGYQSSSSNIKHPWKHTYDRNPPNCNMFPTPQKPSKESQRARGSSPKVFTPNPKPRCRSRHSGHSLESDLNLKTPDVIIEEILDEKAVPPTGPDLANEKGRIPRGRKHQFFGTKRSVSHWVVVTHIVNPSHFYVRYVAEKKESEILSKKINNFCCRDDCLYTPSDILETGSMIFVKWKEGLWCRANVVEILQNDCVESVKACPITQLGRIKVFFLDYGFTKSICIQSEKRTTESLLMAVNHQLRKVGKSGVHLREYTPQAIRCSLKDLVPYDLTKGWSKEAEVEFYNVVGTAAVEMRPLGQDRDSLLVDLRKAPMDQSSDVPISVREYLVFIEVSRFYSPVSLDRAPLRPLLYYPPEHPKINTKLNAVVSHINSPADFYIQLVDNMESLLLSAKLQECYSATAKSGEDLNIYCPVIGQACVALYDDMSWYRAMVIGQTEGRKVEVQYVDFGNKKILPVSDLRKIKEEFFALPSMAIRCYLSEVIPLDGKSWSDACTNRLVSLAHQKLVTIVATGMVPKTEPLPVKLFKSGLNEPLVNFTELLVQEQLACFKEGSKHASPSGDDSAIWDPPLELSSELESINMLDGESLDLQPQLGLLAQMKDLKVRVSHVNSPSSFYVQFIHLDSQLKRICDQVKQQCGHTEPQDVVWKINMYCAAHINGVWERGRICSDVTYSCVAEVMRCDHGNTVKLHVNSLRPLPSTLIGSLGLECTLTDIRPAGGGSTWTATACDLISYYVTGASAVMTIKELTDQRPVPVTLFCSNKIGQFVSIADFLASEGLALKKRKARDAIIQKPKETDAPSSINETLTKSSDGEKQITPDPAPSPIIICPASLIPNSVSPKPAPRSIITAEKVKTPLYPPPDLPCPGHIQINVSAVGEDGIIYARTHDADRRLEVLRERIQQNMKTLPRQKPYTWKLVQGCAIMGPDMLWYRGQLLEVLGGHVKVQYVDYGLVENIPVVHVYPVLLCDDVPQLCIPCQLHCINPVGDAWQQDALALMKEVLLNRCVDMQVVELPTDPRGTLTVEFFLDGMSLTRILCDHEHAFIDQSVSARKGLSVTSPPVCLDDWDLNTEGLRSREEPVLGPFIYPDLPQEGQQFQVKVKHLYTPNILFLWPLGGILDLKVDGETLDEALTSTNENIDHLPHLTNFTLGSPCLAEYSDEKYYRAQLVKFTSIDPVMILVQHVDFGSHDTLPTSKLRQMPARLLQFPSRALKVRVAGFKAPTVNTQEDVLTYSPSWSVKALMDMINLLHSNIKASVVEKEPELTVLLYNEDGELVHLPLVRSGLAELE